MLAFYFISCGDKIMNAKQSKLNVTLNQWKEIYAKEMTYSAGLRNQEKANQAHAMILKLERMIMEAA